METLTLKDGTSLDIAVSGFSQQAILFVAGFGGGREARGLFPTIHEPVHLERSAIMYSPDRKYGPAGWDEVLPLPQQADILREVYTYGRDTLGRDFTHLIAFSLGCVVAAMAQVPIPNQILIVPPMHPPHKKMYDYFYKKQHAIFNSQGDAVIQRSDGATTYAGRVFWESLKSITPYIYYGSLARKHEVIAIEAKDDEVIPDSLYAIATNKRILKLCLPGDHNFTETRGDLAETIGRLIMK